jgi:hypothetical protein
MALKESNDILVLAAALSQSIKSAKADGHVDWMDLPKFAPVVLAAKAAIEGGDKVPGEFSAATTDELVQFAQAAFEAITGLVEAVISK